MKSYFFKNATLVNYERLNNSQAGNPRYKVLFKNEKGESLEGITALNAKCGYVVTNFASGRRKAEIEFHYAIDNIIIDSIKEVH